MKKNFSFSEHHLSHAGSAFFPSPFEKSLIFTADGVGEWATTSLSLEDKKFDKNLKGDSFFKFFRVTLFCFYLLLWL